MRLCVVGHVGGRSYGRVFPEVRVIRVSGSWVDCVKDTLANVERGGPGPADARPQGERARGREGQAEVGVEKLASSVRGHLCYTEGTDGVSPIKGNVYRAPIGTPPHPRKSGTQCRDRHELLCVGRPGVPTASTVDALGEV